MDDDLHFEIAFCHSILKRDANDIATMEILAGLCTRSGRLDEGLEWDRKIVSLDPENAVGHYNLACSLALKARNSEAVNQLRTAMEKGYRDFEWMQEDPDLESLRQIPAFQSLLSEFKNSNPAS